MRQTPERLAILLLLWWAQPASMQVLQHDSSCSTFGCSHGRRTLMALLCFCSQAPAVLLVATNPDSAVARQTFLTQPVVELRSVCSLEIDQRCMCAWKPRTLSRNKCQDCVCRPARTRPLNVLLLWSRDTNSDQPFISGEYKIRASNSIPDRVLLGTTFILPVLLRVCSKCALQKISILQTDAVKMMPGQRNSQIHRLAIRESGIWLHYQI